MGDGIVCRLPENPIRTLGPSGLRLRPLLEISVLLMHSTLTSAASPVAEFMIVNNFIQLTLDKATSRDHVTRLAVCLDRRLYTFDST